MNNYITGATIKKLREARKLTQSELAAIIGVGDKAVSRWETAKGLPDISLIEPLAGALGISVMELMSGEQVTNMNRSGNMQRSKLYVCPVCGNIIRATGEAVVSCCGITLPCAEADAGDESHMITVMKSENEYFVTVDHEMTKTHYISFISYTTGGRSEMVKLYPEGNAEARFLMRGHGIISCYCNRHGLVQLKV